MNIENVFNSIGQIERGITEVYQYFLECFFDNTEYRVFWEEMLQSEKNQGEMLNRCKALLSSGEHPIYETIGKDVNYAEIMAVIDNYKKEMKENLDINKAFRIAFHMELIEIQGIFNEVIKLPQEPYFNILSDLHLETRRTMGKLINGIEMFSTDHEFLYKVMDLKGGIIERRSGTDRRAGSIKFEGNNRRGVERRKGRLEKIICKI